MAFFHGGSIMNSNRTDHIRLTSHPEPGGKSRFPIHWGAADPHARGPIIATVSQPQRRNVIGSHGGCHSPFPRPGGSGRARPPLPPPAAIAHPPPAPPRAPPPSASPARAPTLPLFG